MQLIKDQDIPAEVINAANIISTFFKRQGIKDWELMDLCSRDSVARSYNNGLDTATFLCMDILTDGVNRETLVCALESSKIVYKL